MNAIINAKGAYHIVTRFPRKHVVLAIPLNENPELLVPGTYLRCIEEIKVEFPRITQMDVTIESTSEFGRILVIHVKGW